MSTPKHYTLEVSKLNKLYDSVAYDSLTSPQEAHGQMTEDVVAKPHGPVRDVFLRSKVHDRYGIRLNHNHFPMDTDKRLVEYEP
jgi:hypothetical protein